MAIYAVIPFNQDPDKTSVLNQRIADHELKMYDSIARHVFFVAYSGTSSELTELLGLTPEGEVLGIVMQLGHYYGFGPGSLWEWINANS